MPSLGAQSDATMMRPAGYADVTLLDGPMLEQFQSTHRTLLAMDEDALLKPFRQAAGLPAPGEDLGGWYNWVKRYNVPADFRGFIPGHCFGQYVSGLARAHAITGDRATAEKVRRLVDGFAPTITSTFYENYALPAYTFDKINIGLIDAYAFADCEDALKILNRATDAALPHLPEKALTRPEMEARPHSNMAFTWDESYTLPENLYLAYRRGAGSRFRALARCGQPLSRLGAALPARPGLFRSSRKGGERSAGPPRLQPCERPEFRHAGLPCGPQQQASAGG
jgi:hypothetical protein